MGNIVLLDELTINKIAAGEVIERPASVVKEMVENSIDAGATNIQIEIKNGGISYIRVTDNGKGIAADDLDIAFERHATSKIRSADDLSNVRSMGFRGEALASIAAISKIEMISKTESSEIGNKIVVEAGKILEKEQTGCPTGTTITVENLFFNTPVRYKFLKKDFTEGGYIEDCITRLSLINPHIAFKLISSGKTVIQTSGNGDVRAVIYSIYGKDIAASIVNVKYEFEDIKINGVIGKPEIARSNRANQIFFVNNRNIKDNTLLAAVGEGYRGLLPIGKFAFVVLNIEVNPEKVDVNVHPAKLEVRFSDENKIFKAVYHSVKEGLLKDELVENVQLAGTGFVSTSGNGIKDTQEILSQENTEDMVKSNTAFESITTSFKNLIGRNASKDEPEEFHNEKNIVEQLYQDKVSTEHTIEKEDLESASPAESMQKIIELQKQMQKEVEENLAKMAKEAEVAAEMAKKVNSSKVASIDTSVLKEHVPTGESDTNDITKQKQNITKQLNEILTPKESEIKNLVYENVQEENEVVKEEFDKMYTKLFGKKRQEETEQALSLTYTDVSEVTTLEENLSVFEDEGTYKTQARYKFIGIAFSTYVIIEIQNDLYLVDQHAAHERIMYEKIKDNFYNGEGKDSQLLLLPDVITLTHKEACVAKENLSMFEKAGFMLEEFGENTIKLTGVPEMCFDLDTKELFLDILDEIDTVARTARQEIEEKFIATVACKSSVKANMALNEKEVDVLMSDLLKLDNPFTCPHGRPTAIKMTKKDLEKKFSRR